MKKLSFIFLMCICGLTSCTNKTQSEAISAPSSQIIDATPVVAKESSVLEITPAAIKKTEIATENVPPTSSVYFR